LKYDILSHAHESSSRENESQRKESQRTHHVRITQRVMCSYCPTHRMTCWCIGHELTTVTSTSSLTIQSIARQRRVCSYIECSLAGHAIRIRITRHWPLYENMTSSTNRKYITYRNAVGEPSHGHRQQSQKLVKFGCSVFELCERTDRQADTHTNTHTQTYSLQYFVTFSGRNKYETCTKLRNRLFFFYFIC